MRNEAGTFAWCDLSAYRPAVARQFYADLFGWRWSGEGYDFALAGDTAVAGVFEMPDRFKDMGMPSFWMSYIAVANLAEIVATARAEGGTLEMETDDYALIRDPLGAGFTVHSGLGETAPASPVPGRRHGHGYFCSDLGKVIRFYGTLFGWSFDATDRGYATIRTRTGAPIASALEVPNAVRGREQYWAVRFSVADLDDTEVTALAAGAKQVQRTDLPEGPALLVLDPDNAAFFVVAP